MDNAMYTKMFNGRDSEARNNDILILVPQLGGQPPQAPQTNHSQRDEKDIHGVAAEPVVLD